ncbi:hypothetical protein GCM10020229_45950 [Kitasatospora albolonga]|uniref:hypothetical protein n=1 Tax=Kitasatospora albolonga TaxID=68173 RepID=UPI0031EBA055
MSVHDEERVVEERVAEGLRELAARQEVSGPVPVAELLHRGRRGRRLRTATRVAAAAVGVGAVLTVAVALLPAPAATGPGLPALPAVSPSAVATPSPAASSPAPLPTTGPELLEALRTRIPAGLSTGTPWVPQQSSYQKYVGFQLRAGTATGNLRVDVSRPTTGPLRAAPCAMANCTDTDLPGGAQLQLYLPAPAAGGEQDWRATVRRPDGTMVTVSSGNIPGPGEGPGVHRNAPLLTGPQLTELAVDPLWHQVALTLTQRPDRPTPPANP